MTRTPMRRIGALALSVPLALGLTVGVPAAAGADVAVNGQDVARSMTDTVWSLNSGTGNTLLTTSHTEARNAQTSLGWTGEITPAFRASTTPGPGTVPVYRLQHGRNGTFLYTSSENERRNAARHGFTSDKVAFHVPAWDVGGSVQVHRMQKLVRGMWRYRDVVGDEGRAGAQADGWTYAATTYRGIPAGPQAGRPGQESAPAPTPTPEPAPQPPLDAPAQVGDGDGTFTLVQINDTQADVWSDDQPQVPARVDWILANERAEDIRFTVHTGDLVNWWDSATDNDQYRRADRWIQPLSDSSIPFAMTVGNHDTLAVADGEGHGNEDENGNPIASWGLRQTGFINEILPASDFRNMRGQYEAGKFDNSYHTFTAEGTDFLVLALEPWPREGALAWAESVVRDHPDHNVVLLAHHYLYGNGHVAGDNGGYGSLPMTAVRDRLVLRYPNVKLVLSGHVGWTSSRVDAGPGGNVLSVMTNMSPSNDAPLRLFRIDVPGGTIESDIVSTIGGHRGQHPVSAQIDWIR